MDMVDLVLGIGAAVGASTLYSLGIALQAMDAKEAPRDEHLRLALAWGLLRRARWLAGTGLSILGWPLQVVALLLAGVQGAAMPLILARHHEPAMRDELARIFRLFSAGALIVFLVVSHAVANGQGPGLKPRGRQCNQGTRSL